MTTIHIKKLTAAFLFAPLPALAAAPVPSTSIDARHGKVEVVAGAETTDIVVAGKKIAAIGGSGAALFAIPTTGERDYIVVQANRPVAACRHAYLLLELSDQAPRLSKEFGNCRDLGGAAMSGTEPVVHLTDPADRQAGVESYQWQGGDVTLAFESPSLCSAAGFLAQKNTQPLGAPLTSRVAGSGRLQFLSAPDAGCAMPGVFVVPGDSVTVSMTSGAFVHANYTNPKSGRKVQGWVPRARLADQ